MAERTRSCLLKKNELFKVDECHPPSDSGFELLVGAGVCVCADVGVVWMDLSDIRQGV